MTAVRVCRSFAATTHTPDPTEEYFRYHSKSDSRGFLQVRELGVDPSVADLVRFMQLKKGDFDLLELVTVLHKLCGFSGQALQQLNKNHPTVLKEIVQALKDNLSSSLEYEPFISDAYAKKMHEMTPEEYEQHLQESLDNASDESSNYESKFPRIGEIARCLAVLRINDFEIWDLILKYFEKDRFRTTMGETLSALEGLGFYVHVIHRSQKPDQQGLPERVNAIANKLETVIFKSVWYENIQVFGRIYRSLHMLGKTDNRELFDKVEFYLMNTLDGNYTADEFIDVAHLIVKSGHGGKELFMNLQRIIAYGHYTNMTHPLLGLFKKTDPFTFSTSNLCKISEIYQEAKRKFPGQADTPQGLDMMPDFKVGHYKSIKRLASQPQSEASLSQLELLYFSTGSFDFSVDESRELQSFLASKSFELTKQSVDIVDLCLYLRNVVLPFYSETDQTKFMTLVDDKLLKLERKEFKAGLVGINADSLSMLANVYVGSGRATAEGVQALEKYVRTHIKENYFKLKPADSKTLTSVADQVLKVEAAKLVQLPPKN